MSGRAPARARRCRICTAAATHVMKWNGPFRRRSDLCPWHARLGRRMAATGQLRHFRGVYRFREVR